MPSTTTVQRGSGNIKHRADAIQVQIAEAIQIYGRCALPFSGGFESCLLLHLAEPLKDQIVVITLDTGATFSHVERFFGRVLAGWNRRVVRTDVRTYLNNVALPSRIFSLAEALQSPLDLSAIVTADDKRVISNFDCCCHNRGFPGHRAVKDLGLRAVISDRSGGERNGSCETPTLDGIANVAPLAGHTSTEIQEMIAAFGIDVPDHYPDFDAPHGCSICPAALTPLRQLWMAKLYPDELTAADSLQSEASAALDAKIALKVTAKLLHLNKPEPA